MKKDNTSHNGFTLIELSIVLVIIGLIVGGALVGQDLILAAKLRATISQIREYSTAVNTFKLKYNALPGDYKNAYAMGVTKDDQGNYTTCTDHSSYESLRSGNGNNMFNDGHHSGNIYYNSEYTFFWGHLEGAGLIDDIPYIWGPTELCAPLRVNIMYPASKGVGTSVAAVTSDTKLYFILGGLEEAPVASFIHRPYWNTGSMAKSLLTPLEASYFDQKIDNGIATSGAVFAIQQYESINGSTGRLVVDTDVSGTNCVINGEAYNLADSDKECTLAIRNN